METLLVGNMVMILFWIFMTLIANDAEKYKVIVLLYIITYLVNILKFEYRNFEKIYFTITGLKRREYCGYRTKEASYVSQKEKTNPIQNLRPRPPASCPPLQHLHR